MRAPNKRLSASVSSGARKVAGLCAAPRAGFSAANRENCLPHLPSSLNLSQRFSPSGQPHNRSRIASAASLARAPDLPLAPRTKAPLLAGARADQFPRFVNQQLVRAIERLRKADSAGVCVEEIQIRLEEFLFPDIQGFLALALRSLASLRTTISSASGAGGRSPMAVPRSARRTSTAV